MLGKFKRKGWVLPLSEHCFMHALFTFAIVFVVSPFALAVVAALFDFVVHFIMDRIKASPDLLGRFNVLSKADFAHIANDKELYLPDSYMDKKNNEKLKSNKYFWWSLGLDQAVHHLTHYVIIYYAIMFNGYRGCDFLDSFYCLAEFWRMM